LHRTRNTKPRQSGVLYKAVWLSLVPLGIATCYQSLCSWASRLFTSTSAITSCSCVVALLCSLASTVVVHRVFNLKTILVEVHHLPFSPPPSSLRCSCRSYRYELPATQCTAGGFLIVPTKGCV